MNRLWTLVGVGVLAVAAVGLWFWLGTGEAAPPRIAEADASSELALDKQTYIWDLEHVTFQIEHHFGKPFRANLVSRDAQQLRLRLAADFEGQILVADGGERRRLGPVTEVSWRADRDPRRAVDRDGYLLHLLENLERFGEIHSVALRVLRIDFADGEPDRYDARLALNVLGIGGDGGPLEHASEIDMQFRFTDSSELAGGGSIARLDEIVSTLRASPSPMMEEVTQRYGLDRLPLGDNWELPVKQTRNHRFQLAVEDFDRDGYLDVIVATTEGLPLLLRSTEGRGFEEVAQALGLQPSETSPKHLAINALAAWIDFDNDDYPDLLLGDRLYHNRAGRRFDDVTAASGLAFNRVPLGCTVADFDTDGRLDLYVQHQKSYDPPPPGKRGWVGDSESGARNELWLNSGGGRFRNVTSASGAGGGRRQTFAATSFFFDDDRFPDLYVANDFGGNVLLRNRGDGTFEDLSEESGAADFATSMGVATGDLDNNGSSEIYVANMFSKMGRRIIAHVDADDYAEGVFEQIQGSCAGNRLYRRRPDRPQLDEYSDDVGVNGVGWAYAPAMVDLNGDGWLDLYATTGFMSYDREKPDG